MTPTIQGGLRIDGDKEVAAVGGWGGGVNNGTRGVYLAVNKARWR